MTGDSRHARAVTIALTQYSMPEVTHRVGISQSNLAAVHRGERRLSNTQVENLVRLTGLPRSFFGTRRLPRERSYRAGDRRFALPDTLAA
jgi:hypothetical protein